jgi:hypothetical protein
VKVERSAGSRGQPYIVQKKMEMGGEGARYKRVQLGCKGCIIKKVVGIFRYIMMGK